MKLVKEPVVNGARGSTSESRKREISEKNLSPSLSLFLTLSRGCNGIRVNAELSRRRRESCEARQRERTFRDRAAARLILYAIHS